MQSANGGHDGRYLPSAMDYSGMTHHPHHPHHHPLASDPHSGLHYSLPPSAMPAGVGGHPSSAGHLQHPSAKRVTDLDMMGGSVSSDEDGSMDIKPSLSERGTGRGAPLKSGHEGPPTGKKTKGRVKIKMEFIDNKLRRYTTFSKRKTGIMKKAYELSTLTGTQVMLLVASETGHVYTFATRKLQPMITSDAGKALIQTCLNSPDPPSSVSTNDQRMSVSGYEETELTYNVADSDQQEKVGGQEELADSEDSNDECEPEGQEPQRDQQRGRQYKQLAPQQDSPVQLTKEQQRLIEQQIAEIHEQNQKISQLHLQQQEEQRRLHYQDQLLVQGEKRKQPGHQILAPKEKMKRYSAATCTVTSSIAERTSTIDTPTSVGQIYYTNTSSRQVQESFDPGASALRPHSTTPISQTYLLSPSVTITKTVTSKPATPQSSRSQQEFLQEKPSQSTKN